MKQELVAGDTLSFNTSVPEFPASEGWSLTYKLIPKTSGSVISFSNSSTDGDDYVFAVGVSTTAGWAVGDYTVAAYVTKAGERFTVDGFAPDDRQVCRILPDPGSITAYDGRSHARKMLEAIETALEGFASGSTVKSYTIGTRSVTKADHAELIQMHSRYKWLVANEDATEGMASGEINPRNRFVRLVRP